MSFELIKALQSCTLHPLLIVTSKILTREGFGDVQILDRRESSQKSRFGGHEILCEGTHAGRPVKVVVKVIPDSIRTRMLDELCGTVDRMRADFGIIVTPYKVGSKTPRRHQAVSSNPPGSNRRPSADRTRPKAPHRGAIGRRRLCILWRARTHFPKAPGILTKGGLCTKLIEW